MVEQVENTPHADVRLRMVFNLGLTSMPAKNTVRPPARGDTVTTTPTVTQPAHTIRWNPTRGPSQKIRS